MKICVFGAGAIGGYMGVKLAQAGADVSLVARGPHLAAMQQNGLRLIEEAKSIKCRSPLLTLLQLQVNRITLLLRSAHSVPPVVEKMRPLIGKYDRVRGKRRAVVVFSQNWRAA